MKRLRTQSWTWTVPEQVSLETLPPSIRRGNPTLLISPIPQSYSHLLSPTQKISPSVQIHRRKKKQRNETARERIEPHRRIRFPADRTRVPAMRWELRGRSAKTEKGGCVEWICLVVRWLGLGVAVEKSWVGEFCFFPKEEKNKCQRWKQNWKKWVCS